MTLTSPEYLILLPALAGLGWAFRDLRLWKPLRLLCLLLAVLLLTDPRLRRLSAGMDLWVLMDRSASAAGFVSRDAPEWAELLEKNRPTPNDRLHIVDYAGEVARPDNSEAGSLDLEIGHTRTALALHHVIAQADPRRHSRIVLFTDGYSTEPLADALRKLRETEIPLDFRLPAGTDAEDHRLLDLEIAPRRQVGEPFLIRALIAGNTGATGTTIPLIISRNGQTLIETTVTLEAGRGEVQFSDRISQPGSYHYEAAINPLEDTHSGNNRYETWVEISGGPRILLATRYPDDPLLPILGAQGFDVDLVTDCDTLTVGHLSGTKTIILNNVAAYEIPVDFLDALDFFVRNQGGGLIMAGGKQSFGSGGYFESSVDELLPVSMELKTEHRKLAVAMAVIMDRSGSMGAVVAGGVTKMDLANEGTARAVELLGAQDLVTVFAVDSTPHEIVPPLNVGANRNQIIDRVRRIRSQGGGIFVFNGLEAGWKALEKTDLGQRHIILFSDAADSEEPGRYQALLKTITAGGGTVSVIGLGTDADPDASFLRDIAKRGNGRIFFTRDPGRLPNIFAQETATVARSTFITDPVTATPSGGWYEISAAPLEWLPSADGYNLSYLRENATAALLSTDEYEAPLVAFAQRGTGRSAAISFPIGGEYSAAVRDWPGLGDFMQTLTRWTMGENVPPGIGLRTAITGTRLALDLFHDGEWIERLAQNPPRCVLVEGASRQVREIIWERMAPGHFRASTELDPGDFTRGAIQVAGASLPFGPVTVGSNPEWRFDPGRIAELREASRLSGGRELLDLATAWLKPSRPEFTTLRPSLLTALLLLALLEFLATRLGWKFRSSAQTQGGHRGVYQSLDRYLPRKLGIPTRSRSTPRPIENVTATTKPPVLAEARDDGAGRLRILRSSESVEGSQPDAAKTRDTPTAQPSASETRKRFTRAKKRRR